MCASACASSPVFSPSRSKHLQYCRHRSASPVPAPAVHHAEGAALSARQPALVVSPTSRRDKSACTCRVASHQNRRQESFPWPCRQGSLLDRELDGLLHGRTDPGVRGAGCRHYFGPALLCCIGSSADVAPLRPASDQPRRPRRRRRRGRLREAHPREAARSGARGVLPDLL